MKTLLSVFAVGILLAGCTPSAEQLKSAMTKNPEILFAAIEAHPEKFLEVVNKAARDAQVKQREGAEKEESAKMEEEFKNPKQPVITDKHPVRGKKDAPITLVEYSDFECPFCQKGFETVREVEKAYGDKVKLVYKQLPLEFHPNAMPAAKMFVAIAMQSPEKAFKYHDEVFAHQDKLKAGGKKFLEEAARKAGADVKKAVKDAESEEVAKFIAADMEEAKKFGFNGTPGFLINGVSIRGAYPFPAFKTIIDRQLAGK